MEKKYYIVEDGRQCGPFSPEELRQRNITPSTLVWCQGMTGWEQAMSISELSDFFFGASAGYPSGEKTSPYPDFNASGNPVPPVEENVWTEPYFAMMGGNRVGPESPAKLVAMGLTLDTPVWRAGMVDWMPASSQPELRAVLMSRGRPGVTPNYPAGTPYGNPQGAGGNYPYGSAPQGPGYGIPPTNWLPWAIVATVGGLLSCIGLIFGIIGIVNANKANRFYAMGYSAEGDSANSTAKTMTIIGLVLDGIGLLGSIMIFN